ncbi:MAG: OmpA family protein [Gammaproteobacteria bacterium]|nr:OmpA family protein [Gammaproteobacteria bacterium]
MEQPVRIILATTLAMIMLLSSSSLHDEQTPINVSAESALDAAKLSARLGRGLLELDTSSASHEHESALQELVSDQFGTDRVNLEFRAAIQVPDYWDTATARLIYLLGSTDSASAELTKDGLRLDAVSQDPASYAARREFLLDALPEKFDINDDIILVGADTPLPNYCRKALSRLPIREISFEMSKSSLRSGSLAVLDKLVELAFDCRKMQLTISGHSDVSGSASWNVSLSRARARAVADYLIERGIVASRLQVIGRGAAEPLADNATASGRSRNRRIEIEASWPQGSLVAADRLQVE